MTTTAPPPMERSFLLAYLDSFHRIEGWFDYEAALMFMAYNQVLSHHGVAGDVLEIGVHHGLSTIAIASLRGSGSRLYAVDLFEDLQNLNVSRSGGGDRQMFERNMASFFDDTGFVRVLTCPSRSLTPRDLGQALSFCHIDGGHSRQETFSDFRLCYESMRPGGLVALDDYFNPEFPGVCEGAVEFLLKEPAALVPVAIGFSQGAVPEATGCIRHQRGVSREFSVRGLEDRSNVGPADRALHRGTEASFRPSGIHSFEFPAIWLGASSRRD